MKNLKTYLEEIFLSRPNALTVFQNRKFQKELKVLYLENKISLTNKEL
jgi:hypothetical protein